MEQVDPLWNGIFQCWCWASGGSWATVLSKVTYCWSVFASIFTSVYFLGHMFCYHTPLRSRCFGFFSDAMRESDRQPIWKCGHVPLRILLGSKSLGRIGIQIFSVIFSDFFGFHLCPDILVVRCEISFVVSLTYPAFLALLFRACQVLGSVILRIFTPSWLFVVSSLLSWSPFSPSTVALHLHGCPLISSS